MIIYLIIVLKRNTSSIGGYIAWHELCQVAYRKYGISLASICAKDDEEYQRCNLEELDDRWIMKIYM